MKTRGRGQMSEKLASVRVQVCESGVERSLAGMTAGRFAKEIKQKYQQCRSFGWEDRWREGQVRTVCEIDARDGRGWKCVSDMKVGGGGSQET